MSSAGKASIIPDDAAVQRLSLFQAVKYAAPRGLTEPIPRSVFVHVLLEKREGVKVIAGLAFDLWPKGFQIALPLASVPKIGK
jgi:hypothetical protein